LEPWGGVSKVADNNLSGIEDVKNESGKRITVKDNKRRLHWNNLGRTFR